MRRSSVTAFSVDEQSVSAVIQTSVRKTRKKRSKGGRRGGGEGADRAAAKFAGQQ